jgi:hypothetical protein
MSVARPRRNKPLMAFGIILTSVSPIAGVAGTIASLSSGKGGGAAASVIVGLAGTVSGIVMIAHGAHRMTPEELEESKKAALFMPVPSVSVGLGSVQATWTF